MNSPSQMKNPEDSRKRTYRQINMATRHAYPLGSLVELENGVRLFVGKHTRGAEGEPTYSLGWSKYHRTGDFVKTDFSEYGMAFVGLDESLEQLLN